MIKSILSVVCLFLVCVGLRGQNIETVTIQSEELKQDREILIYTPAGYDELEFNYYNVAYVFDAQNRGFFDYVHSLISFMQSDPSTHIIVVGITSPNLPDGSYGRNNDFLPVLKTDRAKARYGSYSGNVDAFHEYVKNEVIPYVEKNYRTLNHRTGVGHSLSASFLIYSLVNQPGVFDNYMAISPNLAFEDDLLANALTKFDFSRMRPNSFLYLSSADEGVNYWQYWMPARQRLHAFLQDSVANENLTIVVEEFPEKNHLSTFPPSASKAFEAYFGSAYLLQQEMLEDGVHKVLIRVKVPNENDEVYITGNQENLGNWNPGLIKMNRASDLEREIELSLQSPASFKFTKGSWESEANVKDGFGINLMIKPEDKSEYQFDILDYLNDGH